MDPKLVRAFVQRDRASVDTLKKEHWARAARESEGAATVRAGHLLFCHAREVDPEYPSDALRRADLQHHLRLKEVIDRASARFCR